MRMLARLGVPWILLVLAGPGLLLSACTSQRPLTRDEIDSRVQEYYQRGLDAYQKGEFRAALESFRLARAYDVEGPDTPPAAAASPRPSSAGRILPLSRRRRPRPAAAR